MFVSCFYWTNSRCRLLAALLAIVTVPISASAQTTSDLFEKAVYADETAGNLDKAIELYSQVIAKTKKANHIAAEAQYRLGLCFEKQGKAKQAREAFQAVVDNFPKEAKFVTLAKKHLPGALKLLPVPWKDGERLHLRMTLPTGKSIGVQVYSIHATTYKGQPAWRCSNRVLLTLNDTNSFSEVFCDKQSFAPQESYWTHSVLGQANAKYTDDKVTIDLLGREEPLKPNYTAPGYDNEQCMQLFRRFPLEVGFHAKLPVVATLMGNVIPLEIDVPKKETITTAAGKFDCFRLELNIGQTVWISDDANRYPVRFAIGGVVGNLVKIEQRKQDESIGLTDKQFSLKLPKGWMSFEPNPGEEGREIYFLDRRAVAYAELTLVPKQKLTNSGRKPEVLGEDEQATPQKWMEKALKKRENRLKDYKVRDTEAGKLELQGQEVASTIFDFENNKKPMTGYFVSLFGDRTAGFFKFTLPADQFDSQRGEIDQLIRTLRLK